MSGEYYTATVEEAPHSGVNLEEYKSSKGKSVVDVANFYRDNDTRSDSSKKSQDLRLHEIEEQLELAENRCNTLKGQLDSMKKIYRHTGKVEPPVRKHEVSFNPTTTIFENERKRRPFSPRKDPHRPRSTSNKRSIYDSSEFTTTVQKSSSSSTALDTSATSNSRMPIIRQASNCISTDRSGDAVRTINSIISGITDSFNKRITQECARIGRVARNKSKPGLDLNEPGIVYEIPKKPFSPRVEKRLSDQQKKVKEIVKGKKEMSVSDLDKWDAPKESLPHVKSRSLSTGPTAKKKKMKGKPITSTDSIGSKKNVKSTAKHVENTIKLRPVRTDMVDKDSQMVIISKKRKKQMKRLHKVSKASLGRKHSDNDTRRRFEQYTTDNLVELYHNVAARESDSDNSNAGNKSHTSRQQKGAGDVAPSMPETCEPMIVASKEPHKEISYKPSNRIEPIIQRALSPIEENRERQQFYNPAQFYNQAITKNYEMPTISSTLKKATKCYLHTLNFRSIPFCPAKSTSPSHNIGINIQQVMSIIKSRRPVSGISPTLAHNISLAAGRLSSHPLKAFVSTLSSRMGYGRTMCPLTRYPFNYNQLEELAKEIPEEPEEEEEELQHITNEVPVSGASGDMQEANPAPVWMTSAVPEDRCTCTSQKGMPFQQVLSKYHTHPEAPYPEKTPNYMRKTTDNGKIQRPQRQTRPLFCTAPRQRTGGWLKYDARNANAVAKKKSDQKILEGKEKNLKMVLKNLHDEFDGLNTKYEELAKEVSSKDTPEADEQTIKVLEEMETQLNKKEEEINMVMSLYTEVMALKDQVKKLRERTSQQSVSVMPTRTKVPEPNAALHLTQLLRQIQNYQEVCKNKKQLV